MHEIAVQKAYRDILAKIRNAIINKINLTQTYHDLKQGTIHKEIMKTKVTLEEVMDLPPEEAFTNAVRMRKELFDQVLPVDYPYEIIEGDES